MRSSETSGTTLRTTRSHIPEDDTLQNHRCENLKSYTAFYQITRRHITEDSNLGWCGGATNAISTLQTPEMSPSKQPEYSLPCSQGSATGPYSESQLGILSPYPPIYFNMQVFQLVSSSHSQDCVEIRGLTLRSITVKDKK
jgi:hypothetical protein